jgi:FkbM family methyltransferase
LSALVKGSGKVIAIEPMSKFNNILKTLLEKNEVTNVELMKVALGGDGDFVEMGIPKVNNMKKFAYARVINTSSHLKYTETEQVKNETGDALFENLPQLDFIKCDVEGLEVSVFNSMEATLKKHHPILLCELADRNERIKLYEMLMHIGYQVYLLREKQLHLFDVYLDTKAISHNHYFLTADHEEKLKRLISR